MHKNHPLPYLVKATNMYFSMQVQDFTDKVNFYVMNAVTFFKSMWPEVKCNAALFVGKQYNNMRWGHFDEFINLSYTL